MNNDLFLWMLRLGIALALIPHAMILVFELTGGRIGI